MQLFVVVSTSAYTITKLYLANIYKKKYSYDPKVSHHPRGFQSLPLGVNLKEPLALPGVMHLHHAVS
jgi:hypothetical protein